MVTIIPNLLLLLLGFTLIFSSNAQRAKDNMYEKLKGSACFRRLNATHQTGCTSDSPGSTGVVHFVMNPSDLDFILEHGSAPPYIPVIPINLFSARIAQLKKSTQISGVVLYDNNVTMDFYTNEDTCPNRGYGLENTCEKEWNPHGTGLLHHDYPFPVFYVESYKQVEPIRDCFAKFNNFSYDSQYQRSLCSLELSSFMFATTDTPTCIRRSNSKTNLNPTKFCDPLGSDNVWASLFPIENVTKNEATTQQSYIIVAARLDSTSLFRDIVPGAANPVTGIVTLLATARLLKQLFKEDETHYDKNVLFILFNGETYDYIGSQRMAYDMNKGEFPLKPDENEDNIMPSVRLQDLSLFVEVSQLSRSKNVYVHTLRDSPQISSFVEKLKSYKNGAKLYTVTDILPPASLQSFIKANSNISGIVLANHGQAYVNQFYDSIFDNVTNIGYQYYNVTDNNTSVIPNDSVQRYVSDVAEMLSMALYDEITGKKFPGDFNVSTVDMVDELMNCYLLDYNCKIHSVIQRKKFDKEFRINFDVSVSGAADLLTYLIGLTLGWLTGDIVDNEKCLCPSDTPVYQYFNMSISMDDFNKTACFRTTMNFTEAVSPAFVIEDYDWKSLKYSSWTESTWQDLTMRMFLKPSAAHEAFTIAVGSMVLVFSITIVYFVKSRSHILFTTSASCSPTSC